MTSPDSVEREHTLRTATARYEELRLRDALSSPEDDDPAGAPPPTVQESLELLALGEVIARKATYGRQLAVRSARRAGASWTQIGAALGTTKQSAWEAHNRWIDEQARDAGPGHEGLGAAEVRAARDLADGD
ncbi:hypothetical protein [Spirilliplanes yamanashiensis]|uniref:Uncharacterized protein n=1 Tax=Spirilliplanes yamanashiensis TaxID=42233 RepID=A0A8J3YA93_9ACTN|nr:hypothetical protein [Spirilliplanes yamanashiensis]MDP9815835.1 hypothetical protein [Spirilliplanes yamanashiensis]GIJ04090.1 hypothetical protein Sya03_34420 [Spirilliplanes yamanashiensis]